MREPIVPGVTQRVPPFLKRASMHPVRESGTAVAGSFERNEGKTP
jgi:hypothetical protein